MSHWSCVPLIVMDIYRYSEYRNIDAVWRYSLECEMSVEEHINLSSYFAVLLTPST